VAGVSGKLDVLRVAVVQMTTGPDVRANVAAAASLVAQAAEAGARVVVLPEKWNVIDVESRQAAAAEALDGPSLSAVRGWARQRAVWILAGSVSERIPGAGRAFNTSLLVAPDGVDAAVYRKLHLFDVDVGGHAYRESEGASPGHALVVADVDGRRVGLSVCYDLRFPELYRALTLGGAEVLAVPAAFTATTGAAHWETLLRARAIENQAFVVAAGQVGTHATGTASYGHSMVVDPWGEVLARVEGGPGVAVADLDFGRLREVREALPALRHRRPDVYGSPGSDRAG
jgi:predicted amidohydrolase